VLTDGSLIVASCTDKQVSLIEAATGNIVGKLTCGEMTTAMALTANKKHLITASTEGIIYVWRLP